MKNRKNCNICALNVSSLKVSPKGHESKHKSDDERACGECWEAWLSQQVEERHPHEIECLFCKATISIDELARLARDGTAYRYVDPGWGSVDRNGGPIRNRMVHTDLH